VYPSVIYGKSHWKGDEKMADAVEKVPAETRWTIATKVLTAAAISLDRPPLKGASF